MKITIDTESYTAVRRSDGSICITADDGLRVQEALDDLSAAYLALSARHPEPPVQ